MADECGSGGGLWPQGGAGRGEHAVFTITVPHLPFSFTGTGDLTAALLLAQAHAHPRNFVAACEAVVLSLQVVCANTVARYTRLTAEAEVARAAIAEAGEGGAGGPAEEAAAKVGMSLGRARALVAAADRAGKAGPPPAFVELALVDEPEALVRPRRGAHAVRTVAMA